ncbi:MAG TPA: endo-1,4-beta-xylanase [Pedobacter sp.]|uniref:endo-1,4-beta-xylanase n=1 Tax=Pedobacter sp. TaxID=1411316 RepID=UPI002C3DFE11|nr:endo-1,4-beta-xylanase [Pedobacter sp.]HMI01183.1 endo-1,4-beta-xylanase [Pedobacter sp.]
MNCFSISRFSLVLLLIFLTGPGFSQKKPVPIKDHFKKDFLIGAAIRRNHTDGSDVKAQKLIVEQFNSISPENDLKWGALHPKAGVYQFKYADQYVDFGIRNGMTVIGHTLIWHSQSPEWIFKDDQGQQIGRDALLKRMQEHIETVVGRYKGKIKGWDVVNEAFNDDGSFRNTKWKTIIGEDYIEKAFEFAQKADPGCELYYNDYNLYNSAKRAGVLMLVKRLQAKHINIKAVGEQGHYHLDKPEISSIEKMLTDFKVLGAGVNFTELDIDVLPRAGKEITAEVSASAGYESKYDPYKDGLPDSVARALAKRYQSIFNLAVKYRNMVSRITFWGLTDGASWLNNYPVRGRTNYPLLFDRNYQMKTTVYKAITEK